MGPLPGLALLGVFVLVSLSSVCVGLYLGMTYRDHENTEKLEVLSLTMNDFEVQQDRLVGRIFALETPPHLKRLRGVNQYAQAPRYAQVAARY